MFRFSKSRWLAITLVAVITFASCADTLTVRAAPSCGVWSITIADRDPRLEIQTLVAGEGEDCHADFRILDKTDFHGIGGYALELRIANSDNAGSVWDGADPGKKPTALLPAPLFEKIHLTPNKIDGKSRVVINGSMTTTSLAVDAGTLLFKSFLDLIPASGCLIAEDTIIATAIRLSDDLQPAIPLQGHFAGGVYQRRDDA